MNLKTALLTLAGGLLSTGLLAQEIPGESLNTTGPFYPEGSTHTPQGSSGGVRQFNPDYWQNSIQSYYGIMMPGSYNNALKTITYFETSTNDLLVYPNPVYSNARVRLHEPAPVVAFAFVIDMNGNIVRAMQFPAGSLFLDVSMGDLPRGTYSLRIFGPYISFHNITLLKTGDT